MMPGFLLLAAALAITIGLVSAPRAPRVWRAAMLAGGALAFTAAIVVLASAATWDWRAPVAVGGEYWHLRLDGLSAFFLVLVSSFGALGSLYAHEYWSDDEHPVSAPAGRIWWAMLFVAMALILVSANGLHFLIAWEIFAVSGYFLITSERHRPEVREAGWLYLGASHASTLCLFAFFAGLAARTGSWELGPMRGQSELAPFFWLALLGFGLKAGLFPLHIWLPSAHANAPSHVSAILSGVALKMGIYGLVRFSGWLPPPATAGWVVAGLGVASAVLGVAFALGQHDLKRLLAYHSVENVGIILMGLGFAMIATTQGQPAWGRLALAAGLLHVWNHALFKALLFLAAGSVLHTTHTRVMSRLGGLWRLMPWTTGLFFLGAAAIVGLPPLNGFVSEWLLFLGLFDAMNAGGPAAWAAIPAIVLLGGTGALALACFVKVCGVVFLGTARSEAAARAREPGWSMRAPMLVLAAGCVAIGLAPALFWPAIQRATAAWQPAWSPAATSPAPLQALGAFHVAIAGLTALGIFGLWRRVKHNGVSRAVTWDCGYALPTPRMQYTAGSFAAIITEWFASILRPRRRASLPDSPFPASARLEVHTPETVLESIVVPIGLLFMRLSTAVRRLQHGRLQAYMLYLLAGVVALAVLALMGA